MDSIGITERGDAALDLGWLKWVQSKPAILITKDPSKLFDILKVHPQFNIIIHTTITGFGGTVLEPNVPSFDKSIDAYCKLCELYGQDRVVLRVDPIIPTENGAFLARKVINYAKERIKNNSMRIRISFLDNYDHVKERFKNAGLPSMPWSTLHAPLDVRMKVWEELGKPEICGEPGFKCTGCISELDCKILNVIPNDLKKGQRTFCACLLNKKELLKQRSRCYHNCTYCYWKDKNV